MAARNTESRVKSDAIVSHIDLKTLLLPVQVDINLLGMGMFFNVSQNLLKNIEYVALYASGKGVWLTLVMDIEPKGTSLLNSIHIIQECVVQA